MSSLSSVSASANASCERNSVDPFESLSDEVIEKIFNRCALSEIVELMGVSRRFHRIVKSLPIWRLLFERAWKGPYPTRLDSKRGAAYQYFCKLQLLINRGQLRKILLTTPLPDYTSGALCLAVTPDGKIISGFSNGTIQILDVTGKRLACFGKYESEVRSIAVTPDGKEIISGSADGTIRIWNSENGEEITSVHRHKSWVLSIAVIRDGTIVSGSTDKTIGIWNRETGQEDACLRGHTDWISSVVVTPDGKEIISGSNDCTIRIWDIENRRQIACLEGHERWVNSVIFTSDMAKIISGSNDCTIRIWDIENRRQIACLEGHTEGVSSVAVTPNGEIISLSYDGTIRIWNSETGKQIACLEGDRGFSFSVAVTPNGEIISGSKDGKIKVHAYDAKAFENLRF